MSKPTPDELYEQDERIALVQEGCSLPIDVVPRDVITGELTQEQPK